MTSRPNSASLPAGGGSPVLSPAAAGGARPAITVQAHSSSHASQHKFASMVSPGKLAGALPGHTAGSASTHLPITVSAHSHPLSSLSRSDRFTTMVPAEQRQAVPHSDAPDSKPDAQRIYAGITNGKAGREGARKTFWEAVVASAPTLPALSSIDTSSLPLKLVSEVALELSSVGHWVHFEPALSASDLESIRRVLLAELALSDRDSYMVGSAHLVARIFTGGANRDAQLTLGVLVALETKLRAYTTARTSSASPLRNDMLRLQELLQSHPLGCELLEHLSALSFDLVDLGDVVATWFPGMFSAYFPAEFALRAVDLVLLDGPQAQGMGGAQACTVGVMFGMLLVSALQLLQVEDSDALFAFLQDIPATITRAQVTEVYAHAYWAAQRSQGKGAGSSGTTTQEQLEKNWAHVLATQGPGTVRLKVTAGGPTGAAAGTVTTHRVLVGTGSSPTLHPSPHRNAVVSAPLPQPFQAGDYNMEAAAARRSIAMREGGSGSFMPMGVANALASTPAKGAGAASASASTSSPASVTKSLPSSHSPSKQAASSSAAVDAQLLAELTAATAGGARSATVNTQQLLERALREIKRLDQQARPGSSGGAAGASAASSLHSTAASSTAAPSADAASVRALATSIAAITPAGVHGTPLSGSGGALKKVVPSSGLIRYSELLDYQSFPSLCMQGYLNKSRAPSKLFQRKQGSGFFGNLTKRFFVLQGSFLTYFKSHHDLKPTRDESLDLRTAVVTKIRNHEYAPFAFQIALREKGTLLFLLFADNEGSRDTWLECLASATQVPAVAK